MILTKIYYHVIGVIFKVLFMKLLVLLTFCFGFVVCIPWDQVILRIRDESRPTPMSNIYRSGPIVSEEAIEMPEEAPVKKIPGSLRNFLGSQPRYGVSGPGIQSYPEYPEYPGYPEYPPPQYPEEYRGNLGINKNLKAL